MVSLQTGAIAPGLGFPAAYMPKAAMRASTIPKPAIATATTGDLCIASLRCGDGIPFPWDARMDERLARRKPLVRGSLKELFRHCPRLREGPDGRGAERWSQRRSQPRPQPHAGPARRSCASPARERIASRINATASIALLAHAGRRPARQVRALEGRVSSRCGSSLAATNREMRGSSWITNARWPPRRDAQRSPFR